MKEHYVKSMLGQFSDMEKINKYQIVKEIYKGRMKGQKGRKRPRKSWLHWIDKILKKRER